MKKQPRKKNGQWDTITDMTTMNIINGLIAGTVATAILQAIIK